MTPNDDINFWHVGLHHHSMGVILQPARAT